MTRTMVKIVFVHPDRKVCDATTMDGYKYITDIQYSDLGVANGGAEITPNMGDVVVIESDSFNNHKIVERKPHRVSVDGFPGYQTAHPGNQLPGDQTLFGPDGSFLKALRGQFASIGANPMCQTMFIGLEGLIRTLTKNYEFISSGARFYSINDNGKVTNRLVMTSEDSLLAKGDQTSELFELQIDLTEDGFSMIYGVPDQEKGTRTNKFLLNINSEEGLNIQFGDDVSNKKISTEFYISFDGVVSFNLYSPNGIPVYTKNFTTTEHDTVLINEFIDGTVIRKITGNLEEEVGGSRITLSDDSYETATKSKQVNTNLLNTNAGVTEEKLVLPPQVELL